jgi:hypothetical protein
MKNGFYVCCFLVFLFILGCKTSFPWKPVDNDVAKVTAHSPETTLNDLKSGYKLFVSGCSGCHTLYLPSSRTRETWEAVLPEMTGKARMDSSEARLVRLYILSKI